LFLLLTAFREAPEPSVEGDAPGVNWSATACPTGEPGEIVVCADRDADVRYRLSPGREGFDPAGPVESVHRERHRLVDVGASGIGSCSTVGPGGVSGCDARRWKAAEEQKAAAPERASIKLGPIDR